jgi:predicted TIM-barrel fold metal-dependent hydrolase
VGCSGCEGGEKKQVGSAFIGLDQATYEAELAHLRAGAPATPYEIINCHEHLMAVRHFPRYLAAARKQGIRRTVVVTSPAFTLFGKGDKTYASMAKNWQELRRATEKYPGEIVPFATVDPHDPDKLEHLKQMVAEGARGVKLYSGHSNLKDLPLDDPSMMPVYAYIEAERLPLNWHINLSKFGGELERVMEKHPELNVMVPHYGVAFWRPEVRIPALAAMMRKYPAMYVDTSLGTREILIDGMFTIGGHIQLFRDFFEEFQDRIVYGSDAVITGNREKTTSWFHLVIGATRNHLERQSFVFPLAEAYSKYFKPNKEGHNPEGRVRGLALSEKTLRKVYLTNAVQWMEKYAPLPPLPER